MGSQLIALPGVGEELALVVLALLPAILSELAGIKGRDFRDRTHPFLADYVDDRHIDGMDLLDRPEGLDGDNMLGVTGCQEEDLLFVVKGVPQGGCKGSSSLAQTCRGVDHQMTLLLKGIPDLIKQVLLDGPDLRVWEQILTQILAG